MEKRSIIFSLRVLTALLFFVVIEPLLPILISRDWGWWEAWVFGGIGIFGFVVSRVLAGRKNPDLIKERGEFLKHENTLPWDRVLAPLVGLGGVLVPLTAGLDALESLGGRAAFVPPAVKWIALGMILFGWWVGTRALMENRFFSGVVRIQKERGQRVVSTGPYSVVRHPGYAGAFFTYLGTPIFLDSPWTFVPVVLLMAVLVVRTRLEDKTLQEQLEGYREYAERVRYRLFPGLW